jgi:hypothetical protein
VPRHSHPERKQERRHRARLRAKATKAAPRNEYVLRAVVDPPRRVELTLEQRAELRRRGLRSSENVAPWLASEVIAAEREAAK